MITIFQEFTLRNIEYVSVEINTGVKKSIKIIDLISSEVLSGVNKMGGGGGRKLSIRLT